MEIIRLSTKGQIVIPRNVRVRHRWGAGTELILEERGDVLILRAANPFPAQPLLIDGVSASRMILEERKAGL